MGCTRAKEKLFLTFSIFKDKNDFIIGMSRFISEIMDSHPDRDEYI